MKNALVHLILLATLLSSCVKQEDSPSSSDPKPTATPIASPAPKPSPTANPSPGSDPFADSIIVLDAAGEKFQASIASRLAGARYMEKQCRSVTNFESWPIMPMRRCRYQASGKTAEVLMLNPGPRRLTKWIQEACADLSKNAATCMQKTFDHIMNQSGAQFPVAGIVIEDMDGNGQGNSYAFRNGVTVQVSSFATATEIVLTEKQLEASFTDKPLKTYSYARIASTTREQLTRYAEAKGLALSRLGSSSEQSNVFNEVVGILYQRAWYSPRNELIRAWVYSQGF